MSDGADSVLSLEAVSLEAGNTHLRDLSLTIDAGGALAVLGSRLSGKFELLQLCAGLKAPSRGTVRILGQDLWSVSERARTALMSAVPYLHEPPLFLNNVRLYDNLALPLRYHSRLAEDEIHARVDEAAARAGLDEYDSVALPMTCSRQLLRRAAYARALTMSPKLLVIEELGAVVEEGDWVVRLLLEHRRAGGALLYSAPAPEPTKELCDRVVLIDRGDVVAIGEPERLARSGELADWRARLREES